MKWSHFHQWPLCYVMFHWKYKVIQKERTKISTTSPYKPVALNQECMHPWECKKAFLVVRVVTIVFLTSRFIIYNLKLYLYQFDSTILCTDG